MKVLIVGGVAGGASAAARLRRLTEDCEIILFERGSFVSYANCGLPYYISGKIAHQDSLVVTQAQLFRDRFNIDVRTESDVVKIDRESKKITVKNKKDNISYEESYDKLILSPGASPKNMFPKASHFDGVFTLRTVPDTVKIRTYIDEKKARSAIVIGGGFIGIETAENLREAGLDVTIVEFAPHIIASMDADMAVILHEHLQSKGVSLWLKSAVERIEKNESGLSVFVNNGKTLRTDIVIMSVGVEPESKLAKEAGLELGIRNSIAVNEYLQTNDPDIFAVGDAISVVQGANGEKTLISLAGPANRQGRAVAANVLGQKEIGNVAWGSSVLKVFDMTAASTGLSEESLKRAGITSYYKTYIHPNSHASYYPGAAPVHLKMIFSKDGAILGVQAVGYEGVEKHVDIIASAMQLHAKVSDLENLDLCYAPPYSSAKAPVNMLGYTASNILKGDMNPWYAEDYDLLDLERVQILDIRFKEEHVFGNIEGAISIPVDELRDHLDELDKEKPVFIICMIGLRGHVASRFLKNNGFKEVYNLMGGFKTWKFVRTDKTIYNAISTERTEDEKPFISSNDSDDENCIIVDACGLACPGPIMKVSQSVNDAQVGKKLIITATDPAFLSDIKVWCERTENTYVGGSCEKGLVKVCVKKGSEKSYKTEDVKKGNDKSMIVFSGDLDKAIASFIIANGAAAMGRKVTMFFTFWGLTVLRKQKKVAAKKSFIGKIFSGMLPRGSKKLALSKMNMGGMGARMIRGIMKKNNVPSLEELIESAKKSGVRLVACQMSMDLMGITEAELIEGVELGGVATFLGSAENADTNLFI